jgi:hypothetical protein
VGALNCADIFGTLVPGGGAVHSINFGLGCALLVSKTDGRRRVAQAIVATVIHYCGLLFEQPSELRYARLICHVDLKRRDRDASALQRG